MRLPHAFVPLAIMAAFGVAMALLQLAEDPGRHRHRPRPECGLVCAEYAPPWSWEAGYSGARWTSPPGQCGADRGCTAASDDGCDPCTVATLGAVCAGRCYAFTPIGGWR